MVDKREFARWSKYRRESLLHIRIYPFFFTIEALFLWLLVVYAGFPLWLVWTIAIAQAIFFILDIENFIHLSIKLRRARKTAEEESECQNTSPIS
jgi:hypothetical protein